MRAIRTVFGMALMAVPAVCLGATVCPTLTGASGAYYATAAMAGDNCNVVLTAGVGGGLTSTLLNVNPYDGSDDNYIGFVNNSGAPVSSVTLSSSTDLFAFDGDGIDTFGAAGNSLDTGSLGGYGGPNVYFTNVSTDYGTGTVNFITPVADGGTAYFSLEEAPSATVPITGTTGSTGMSPVPEPGTLMLFGTGALGLATRVRQRLRG